MKLEAVPPQRKRMKVLDLAALYSVAACFTVQSLRSASFIGTYSFRLLSIKMPAIGDYPTGSEEPVGVTHACNGRSQPEVSRRIFYFFLRLMISS